MTDKENEELDLFKKEFNEKIIFISNIVKQLEDSKRNYWIERIYRQKTIQSKIDICKKVKDYYNLE